MYINIFLFYNYPNELWTRDLFNTEHPGIPARLSVGEEDELEPKSRHLPMDDDAEASDTQSLHPGFRFVKISHFF